MRREGGRVKNSSGGREGRGERGGGRVIICMHIYLATAWTVLHISPI